MSLPLTFKPSKNFKFIRLGNNNDGGYLLGNQTINDTKTLISFGVLDDCSFENDFKEKNQVKILCFDQINYKTFWIKKIYNDLGASIYNFNFPFLKKTLSKYFMFKKFFKNKSNFLFKKYITKGSLNEILENNKNIEKPLLLKIDIEGSEYRLLDEIISNQNFLSGLIIEFHDVDLNLNKINEFIENFSLSLSHIHPNNYGLIDNLGNPSVIEMTFEKNPVSESGKNILPNLLDQPCDPEKKDIELNFSIQN